MIDFVTGKKVIPDGTGFLVDNPSADITLSTTKTFITEFASIYSGSVLFTSYKGTGTGQNSGGKLLLVGEDGEEIEVNHGWASAQPSSELVIKAGKKYSLYATFTYISGSLVISRYSFSGTVVDAINPIAIIS
jgi:hypothetical protein